jgi:Flp pilus assembly protein TadB
VLGSVYHSLGDLETALHQYQSVAESGANDYSEAAWFNVGVVYALQYHQSHEAQEVEHAIAALEESLTAASRRSPAHRAERMRKIQEELQPVDQRPRHPCGAHYHVTQDLTPLRGVQAFTAWWNQKQGLAQRAL